MKSMTTLLYSISVVCLDNTPHGCIFEFLVRNYSCEKRFQNRSADLTCEIPEDKGFIYFSSEFEQVLRALGFKKRPLMALKGTAKIRNMTPVVKGVEKGDIE